MTADASDTPGLAAMADSPVSTNSATRVGWLPRVAYGVGEMPITVAMVLFGLFVMFFYGSVMRLPGTLVGIGAAAGLLWDALIDPYIGFRSDASRHRLGRRHGYMVVGALTMGACFWLLLSPPRGLGTVGLFGWLLGTTLLFRLTSALYRIPYLALGAEMSDDYHERTSIAGVRAFFGLVGTLGAATLSFIVFFPNVTPGVDPKLGYEGYPAMGLAFGGVMTIAGLAAVLGTLRYRTVDPTATMEHHLFVRGCWSALRNGAFRRVWLSFTLFYLGVVVNAAVAVHFFTWYVRIHDSQVLSRVQMAFYVAALAGVLTWMWVSRRIEKHRLCVATMAATAVLLALASLLFGEGRPLGTGHVVALITGHALAGFFASGVWVLPGSMVADVADEDELVTGGRRQGVFFGMLNFGEKIAAGGAMLLTGVLLQYFVGLSTGQVQMPAAVERVGVVYGLLPSALVAVSALLLVRYPLDRAAVASIQESLGRRRAEGGALSPLISLGRATGPSAATPLVCGQGPEGGPA